MWAKTRWPFVSSTRNIALGRASTTDPSISITPSLLAMHSLNHYWFSVTNAQKLSTNRKGFHAETPSRNSKGFSPRKLVANPERRGQSQRALDLRHHHRLLSEPKYHRHEPQRSAPSEPRPNYRLWLHPSHHREQRCFGHRK